MKKLSFIFIYFLLNQFAFAQDGYKISLLGKWNNPNLPKVGDYQIWSDLTGYYDSITKREYIIAGSIDSIYFFDVTDPKNIVLCDVEDGISKRMINRDMECYLNYVYCVSDNGMAGKLQVFDLSFLPDSVHKVYESDSIAKNTHSIVINKESKRLYMCTNRLLGGGRAAMDIISLEQPENPTWIGRLKVPQTADGAEFFRTVHEAFVRNDTAYCSVEYYGLWIFDLTDLEDQKLIGIISNYAESGYNHNSWLNAEGNKIIFTDEVPGGLSVKIFDITDPWNAKSVTTFRSNIGATAHNPIWIGNFAYVSYYHDGFYIFNVQDLQNVTIAGYYHTSPWPPASYDGYKGNWGSYPFLPSGNIALTDMAEGIFMVKPDADIVGVSEFLAEQKVDLYPNPVSDILNINIKRGGVFTLTNLNGNKMLEGSLNKDLNQLNLTEFANGIYLLTINQNGFQSHHKIIKK